MTKTYRIVANRKPADVITGNDVTLETGLTLEEARRASLEYQRQGRHVAVWIEEETKPAPRIVRTVERDVVTGRRVRVTYCDGWAI
jgi:hypothetical protein